MNAETYMMLGQATFLVGTSFLIKQVLKNRNGLKDFDTIGSGLTFLGMIFTGLFLYEMKMYTSILISIPTVLFWGLAFIFSMKNK